MNEKVLSALIEAGAVNKVRIVTNGATVYVEVEAGHQTHFAETVKGKMRTWATINAAAKWLHRLGIGHVYLDISKWQPGQTAIRT